MAPLRRNVSRVSSPFFDNLEPQALHEILDAGRHGVGGLLDRLTAVFGREALFVELQRHLVRDEEAANDRLVDLAAAFHVPLVATNGVRFATPPDRPLFDVLSCLRFKTTLEGAGRRLARNAERYLKPPEAMRDLFRDPLSARELAERSASEARAAAAEFEQKTTAARAEIYRQMDEMRRAALAERAEILARTRADAEAEIAAAGARLQADADLLTNIKNRRKRKWRSCNRRSYLRFRRGSTTTWPKVRGTSSWHRSR